MKTTWWQRLLLIVGAAVAIHFGALWALPRAIVVAARAVLWHKVGINRIHHAPLPDATWRTVVMPSPDLLYSACAYDVRKQPLLIDVDIPDTYWSIAAFSATTDNFFVQNDVDIKSKRARFLLTAQPSWTFEPERTVIHSPTATGIVLFRILVKDRKDLTALEAVQRQASCAVLP